MYMDLFGNSHHGEKCGLNIRDDESGRISINPGYLEIENESVQLILDIRYPVTFSAKSIIDKLNESLHPYGATASVLHHMNKVYMPKDGPVIGALTGAFRDVTGDNQEPIVIGGGTYARSMDNIVAFGPVFPGQEKVEHNANEYIEKESLGKMREIYYLALKNLLALEI